MKCMACSRELIKSGKNGYCGICSRKRDNYRILFKRKKEMDELYELWIEAGGTPAEL